MNACSPLKSLVYASVRPQTPSVRLAIGENSRFTSWLCMNLPLRIFNFVVVMVTGPSFSAIGWKTYIVFAALNAFIIPVVYLFFPGKSLVILYLEVAPTIIALRNGWKIA